ncbi:hypothetical protein C8R43DRAFT_1048715 [Mycena crocata]|nr:hypothetical protein C8R43DRAFT_1048715 [Mycena crocata]
MLRLLSDVFDGMFGLPRGNRDETEPHRDGKTVLVLPEPSNVLYRLLILAYPEQTAAQYALTEATCDGISPVHQAADKYQFIRAQRLLEEMLTTSTLCNTNPHRFFAIAKLCSLPDLVRKTALCALQTTGPAPEFPEMKLLTWDDSHNLYQFRRSCGANAESLARSTAQPLEERDGGAITGSAYLGRRNQATVLMVDCGTQRYL